ncbi:MAG: 3-keto-5-aminohexanoate cleavage protein [Polymorphobacter sp.]
MQPLIIEVALNGGTPKSRNAHVPKTPAEITADALACMAAGAAIVHSHIDDYKSTGAVAAARYLEGWAPVLAARPDAILCATVAGGGSAELRFGHYAPLAAAGMRMGSLDPGSVNLASHGADGLPGPQQFVYATSFADIAWLVDAHIAARLGPSIAIYEPGFLRAVLAYERAGRFPAGALVKFYFGGPYNMLDGQRSNITFGLPPTATALVAYLEMMEGSALPWSVTVMGGDVTAEGLTRLAIERGGHVRVGLEDFAGERAPTNVELVSEVVAIAAACGRAVATPAQAAALLGLP